MVHLLSRDTCVLTILGTLGNRVLKKFPEAPSGRQRPASLGLGAAGNTPGRLPNTLTSKLGGVSMKFRPLHDRVVVRRVTADEKTAGGIIIPDTAQ